MNIRRAGKKDIKEIAEIYRLESSKKPYCQNWDEKDSIKKISEFLNDYIYILENEKIMGFIIVKIRIDHNGKTAFVEELWIKSEYQGKGYGTMLMQFIEKEFKKLNIQSIFLISDKTSKAFNFYKKLKFEPYQKYILMGKNIK